MFNPFKRPPSVTPAGFSGRVLPPEPPREASPFTDGEKMLRITLVDEGDFINVRTADNFGSNDGATLEVLQYAASAMGLKIVPDANATVDGDVYDGVIYILVNAHPTTPNVFTVTFEDEQGNRVDDWNFQYDMIQGCLSIMGYNLTSA